MLKTAALINIIRQKEKNKNRSSYKTEKIYSKIIKKVLAFYITSWYIIFTPDMGEKTKVREKLVD
jgi:hypothetical protein